MKHIAGGICVGQDMLRALNSRVISAAYCLVIDEQCLRFDPFTSLFIAFDSTRKYDVLDGCDVVPQDSGALALGRLSLGKSRQWV